MSKSRNLTPDQNNANRGTERGRHMLETSLRNLGAGRSILLDKHGNVIAGNKTLEVANEIGLDDVQIVQSDGRRLIAVQRTDLDLTDPTGKARQLAYADNRVGEVDLDFDFAVIQNDIANGVDLSDYWFAFELPEMANAESETSEDDEGDIVELPLPGGVPDAIWPSDNEWGIPLLDITRQCDAVDLPIETWGAKGRKVKAGTYHFYTEDYRFNAIWENPQQLLIAGCVNVVEPNFSVYDQVPRAVAIWATYRKRWLARYWQSQGVRVIVDLNVARPYDDINLMGVPKGWKAYATRGYSERLQSLDEEFAIAKKHAETDGVLFVVYGGGKAVREWCKSNGALWVVEDMDRAKGRYLDEVDNG